MLSLFSISFPIVNFADASKIGTIGSMFDHSTGAFATDKAVGGITLFPEVIDGATTVVFKEFGSADVKTCAALIEVAELVEVSKLVLSTKVEEVSDWLT